MKKALVLGALAGQVDAVETLKRRGVETHVCGHVRQGPGVDAADGFHIADITNPDQIAELAARIGADLVYSVGSDIAMPTVVRVSEDLGLPVFHGAALTDVLRRKQELRKHLDDAGLSPVRYATIPPESPIPTWNVFPCIVKPVDAQGQRGISIVESSANFAAAVEAARASSISGPVIVEELLVGPEVSAHVLVRDGEIIFFMASDRHVWDGPMIGVAEGHSVPLREETQKWEVAFRDLITRVVDALGVREGPLYVQAIVTDEGPKIVEIASRLDGCHCWRMIKHATGIDLLDIVLGRLLGDPWPKLPEPYEVRPTMLQFFLDSPDAPVTEDSIRASACATADFVEIQLEEDGRPRRTNEVVSRLGYQVYPNK